MKKTFKIGNGELAESILFAISKLVDAPLTPADWLKGLGYQITIETIKARQTDSQRGMYWANLHEFGRHLGYDARETEAILHNHILCCAYGVKEVRQIGASTIEIPKERSSKQNREDYGFLIDTLLRRAAEEGYTLEG